MSLTSPVPTSDLDTAQARRDLAAAHRLAVMDDLHEGTWNHFSLRMPGTEDRFLVTPASTHWSQVTASSLVELGPDSHDEVAARGGLAWVAYCIHGPILWARPELAAVLHVHSPHLVALSMLEEPRLEPAEQAALDFHARTAVTERFDAEMAPGLGHGRELAAALGERDVLIMRNHGAIVVGRTIGEAYTDLYALERAARALILALSTGRPLRRYAEDIAATLTAGNKSVTLKREHFAAMKRVLDADGSDYER
jgi:ribulose-5-phosphate 4-epimerase/fuculose-1-phosphate aldolase